MIQAPYIATSFQAIQISAENKRATEHCLLRTWTKNSVPSVVSYILKIILSKICLDNFVLCGYIGTRNTQNSPSNKGMSIYKH